jgi:hypothetical protein
MDKEKEGLAYLRQKFSKISGAKKKRVIFFGQQITKIFEH